MKIRKRMLYNIDASLSLEYAILIAVVAAALIGMSVYVKRSLSSKWRDAGDAFGYGRQYEPGKTTEIK